MSTTSLIIEHVITGIQAAIWILLILLTIFGYSWLDITVIRDFSTILTILGLAIIYPIGIFVDNLADQLFDKWMQRIRTRRFALEGFHTEQPSLTAMYLLQRTDDDFLKAYFNYIRVRIRVSRSTTVNFALITISSTLFTLIRCNNLPNLILICTTEILVGTSLTVLALWAWRKVTDTFAKQIARSFQTNPELYQPQTLILSSKP